MTCEFFEPLDQESIALAIRPVLLLKWGAYCTQFSSGLGGGQNLPRASHKPQVSRNKAETWTEHLQDRAAPFKGSAGIGEGLGIPGTGLDHHQGMGRTVGCLESRQVWRTGHHRHGDNITTVVQEIEQAGPRSEGTVKLENVLTQILPCVLNQSCLLTDVIWENWWVIVKMYLSSKKHSTFRVSDNVLSLQGQEGEGGGEEIIRVLFYSHPCSYD